MPGKVRIVLAWLFAVPFLILSSPGALSLAGGAPVAFVGLCLRGWAASSVDKGVALATAGPYAYTRNPLYLGSLLIGLGLGVAGGHWVWPVAFAVLFLAVYVPTMRQEALELEERFGDRYREYRDRVPMLAVNLTPFRTPVRPGAPTVRGPGVGWRRYLRYREWEAALGVATVLGVLTWKATAGG